MVFIAPVVAVSTAPPSIEAVCASLFVVRWIGCALHALVVKGQGLTATAGLAYRARLVSPLVRAGGWFGLIALSGPLIGYGDRFIVASIGSLGSLLRHAARTRHEDLDRPSRAFDGPLPRVGRQGISIKNGHARLTTRGR
jgi:hypothetical protein